MSDQAGMKNQGFMQFKSAASWSTSAHILPSLLLLPLIEVSHGEDTVSLSAH
jgi:hypothetical protein